MESGSNKYSKWVTNEEEAYIPETSSKYANYIRCLNIGLCVSTCCIYPCPLFVSDKIARSSWTRLTEDAVECQEASADCCCAISKRKATIPLENVNVTTGCCLSCYGLKQLDVLTIGSSFSDARICFVKDPEGYRERILAAKKRKKDQEMSAVVVKKEEPRDPISKLKEIKELLDMDILSQEEYLEIKAHIMKSDEFAQAKLALVAKFMSKD